MRVPIASGFSVKSKSALLRAAAAEPIETSVHPAVVQRCTNRALVRLSPRHLAVALLGASILGGCSLSTNLDGLSSNDSPRDAGRDYMLGTAAVIEAGAPHDAMTFDRPGSVERDIEDDAPIDGGEITPEDGESSDGGGDPPPLAERDGAIQDVPPVDANLAADASFAPDMASAPDADPDLVGMDGSAPDGAQMETPGFACRQAESRAATLQLLNGSSSLTSCAYARGDLPPYYAAVDPGTYSGSAACGVCLRIQTPAGAVEAQVVDQGPSRTAANPSTVAINKAAMDLLVPDGSTYVDQGVTWQFTACTTANDGLAFTFQNGSNASYAALLIQNHRYALDKVEYRIGDVVRPLNRTSYNNWVAPNGMGGGPFILRLTDTNGQMIEQTGIPLIVGKTFRGLEQFPVCRK